MLVVRAVDGSCTLHSVSQKTVCLQTCQPTKRESELFPSFSGCPHGWNDKFGEFVVEAPLVL